MFYSYQIELRTIRIDNNIYYALLKRDLFAFSTIISVIFFL